MRWFQNIPIKQKLLLLMVLASTVTLLVAGTAILMVEFYGSRARGLTELAAVADSIEFHEAARLAADGDTHARQIMEGLRYYPNVTVAALFGRDGRLQASYRQAAAPAAPVPDVAPTGPVTGLEQGYVVFARPIGHRGDLVATVYLAMDVHQMYEHVTLYGRILATVMVGGLLVSFLTAATVRRLVARPILDLAAAATAVASGDLKARVTATSQDEVGRLGQTFNRMTEQLAGLYDSLEMRVTERTQALAQANAALQKEVGDRRRAEEALQKEQQLLETFMENVPDVIYFKDKASRFIRANTALVRKFAGRSISDILGKTDFDFFTPVHAQQAFDDEQNVLRTGQPLVRFDEKETWPDGRVTWVASTKMALRDERGRIVGTFGISSDITQRKLAEQALEQRTQELREKHEQIEADLVLAREFQMTFLPQQFPSFPAAVPPEASALRFCSRYRPSGTVGGDFYDLLPLADHVAGVFVCDVMGHGVRAALVTAIVRGLVAELKPVAMEPGRLLTEINRVLAEVLRETDSTIFATAFYLVVDASRGSLRYACAGHPRPYHLRRGAGEVTSLAFAAGGSGPVLGLFADSEYQTTEATVAAGDALMLYTDGVYEVAGANGDFGKERLLEATRSRLALPVEQVFDGVLEDVQQYAIAAEFADDVCLVGVEVARVGEAAD